MIDKPRKIELVYTKVLLKAQQSDFAYWQKQPYQARLDALEEIRSEYNQWKYCAEPEFQRVVTIVKKQSLGDK